MNAYRVSWLRISAVALALTGWWTAPGFAQEPLPSWNDTAPRKAIMAFVERVTKQGSPDFVPPAERIATFDNDGTLWAEQPIYFQLVFALDRVKALAPLHPEWKDKEPLPHCSEVTSRAHSPAASPPFSRSSRSRIPA
jgi:hypothetical protein